MRRLLQTCALLPVILTPLGCADLSNVSMIMDPDSFPPGRYGLYECKSGQLILTHELKADQTFGFEYVEHPGARNAKPNALTIARRSGDPDGSMSVVWRVPLKPSEYQWRPLATTVTAVPTAVVSKP